MDSGAGNRRVLRIAAISGTLAWMLGVAVAVVLLALFSRLGTDLAVLLPASVVFYYTFHLWPLVLVPAELSANAVIFAPVAMVVLFWAGFRTSLRTDAASGRDGFRRGATVTIGYLGLAVLSLAAFSLSVQTSPLSDPFGTAIILSSTGVAFPVVFGGLGGWIAGR